MGQTLFSLCVWLVWSVLFLAGGLLLWPMIALSPKRAFPVVQAICRLGLWIAGIRVEVRGVAGLSPDRPYLFLGNHQSMADPFWLAAALPFWAIALERDRNFGYPIYGKLIRAWGNIPISATDHQGALHAVQLAAQAYRSGQSVIVFPEGTPTQDSRLGPFKKGAFHLALQTEATIVPFAIVGGYERLPLGSWHVRPGTVRLTFGEPFSARPYAGRLSDLVETTRQRIEELGRLC